MEEILACVMLAIAVFSLWMLGRNKAIYHVRMHLLDLVYIADTQRINKGQRVKWMPLLKRREPSYTAHLWRFWEDPVSVYYGMDQAILEELTGRFQGGFFAGRPTTWQA